MYTVGLLNTCAPVICTKVIQNSCSILISLHIYTEAGVSHYTNCWGTRGEAESSRWEEETSKACIRGEVWCDGTFLGAGEED